MYKWGSSINYIFFKKIGMTFVANTVLNKKGVIEQV